MVLVLGFPAYKSILLLTNVSVFVFLVSIFLQHYQANHNLYSWSSLFHMLCAAWLLIRGMFWYFTVISVNVWDESYFELLYWMPNPLQFGGFLIFPLFFAQILYRGKWEIYWTYLRPIYIIVLVCLILFQLFWALLAFQVNTDVVCDDASPESGKFSNNCGSEHSSGAYRVITSACFLILTACQATFSFQVMYLDKKEYQRYFSIEPRLLLLVNSVLILSFFSKGVYQLGAYFAASGWFVLPDIPLQGREDVSGSTVLTFELWDYVPTLLLMTAVAAKPIGRGSGNAVSEMPAKRNDGRNTGGITMYNLFSGVSEPDDDDAVSIANDSENLDAWIGSSYQQQQQHPLLVSPTSLQTRYDAPRVKAPKSWLTGTAQFGPVSSTATSAVSTPAGSLMDTTSSTRSLPLDTLASYPREKGSGLAAVPSIPPRVKPSGIKVPANLATSPVTSLRGSSSVAKGITNIEEAGRVDREAYLARLKERVAGLTSMIAGPYSSGDGTISRSNSGLLQPGLSSSPLMSRQSNER